MYTATGRISDRAELSPELDPHHLVLGLQLRLEVPFVAEGSKTRRASSYASPAPWIFSKP